MQVFDYSAPVRVLLGTAIIFQAVVILRYISYFKQLNVSFPKVAMDPLLGLPSHICTHMQTYTCTYRH